MSKRFILILPLVLMPFVAAAEGETPTPQTKPAESPAAASAAGLGPDSSVPAGGSNADTAQLQPAGQNPLQSTAQDANGLTAPNQQALQAPATSDDSLRVIMGEADGPTYDPNSDPSAAEFWAWSGAVLAFALLITFGSMIVRDRRRFQGETVIATDGPNDDNPAGIVPEPTPVPSNPAPATESAPELNQPEPKEPHQSGSKARKHRKHRH